MKNYGWSNLWMDHSLSTPEKMENLLNGKSIDDIEEFQPGSTPQKSKPSEEFHFGPNAAPFTPVRHLDQSETGLSTKAIFGDESAATLGTTFSESVLHDATVDLMSKESDPMSMSFYADKGDINPFDLNEVQMLPDESNDSVLDAPEQKQSENITLNNDDAIQTTDLDKQAYDDEKELASPLEPDVELLESTQADEGKEECDNINIEPNNELISDFCQLSIKEPVETLPPDVELITPEPRPLSSEPEQLINDEREEAVIKDDFEVQKPEVLSEKIQEQLQMDHDSEIFETKEELDPFQPEISPPKDEGVLLMSCEVQEEQTSDLIESIEQAGRDEVKSPLIVDDESIRCEFMVKSPVCDLPEAKSPLLCDITEKSSVCDIESKSPIPDQIPEPQEDLIEPVQESCDYTKPELIAEANAHFEELCQPVEASITSSIKDEISSPAATPELMEDNFSENHFVASPTAEESKKIEPEGVQQIDVKTENISPQFPEEAIVTPSEEIKDDVPTAPLVEEPVQEPSVELLDQITAAALDASVAAVGVAAAVAAVTALTSSLEPTSDLTEPVTPPTKLDDKKKASSVKKASATKTSTTAPKTTPRTLAAKTTTSKPSPSPKPSAPKSATKPALSGVSPKPAPSSVAHKPSSASKLLTSKPKPTTTAQPKPQADKKPLTNGDVKAPIKSTLLARKTVSETTTAKAARPISAAVPKPTTAAAKPTNPRPASAPRTTGLAPKPKPATLSSRPAPTKTSTTTSATTKSSTTTAATTKTSPRPAATTSSTAKPRVPLSRPIGKAPDKEKQNKDSANKITASKVSTTKTSGSTTVRKVESKTIGARTTVSKTSTTTMKSTTAKKPAEIIRNPSKTKTTKIEKPKENGVSTVVTEEITIVNTTNTVINGEPQLVKDNSPIDNKLLIGDNLVETNAAD